MIVNITRKPKHAVLLDSDHIRSLWDLLGSFYSEVTFYFKCSDGSRIIGSDVNDVIGFKNGSSRKIVSMFLEGEGSDLSKCEIDFYDGYFNCVEISVKDTDDARALKVIARVQEALLDARPWYSVIARIPVGLVLSVIIALIGIGRQWFKFVSTGRIDPDGHFFTVIIMVIPIAAIYVGGLIGLDKFWRWMFPCLYFKIGRQSEGFDRRVAVRKWVFGSLLFSFLLGVAVNLFSEVIA